MPWHIEYSLKFQPTPLSRWVHKAMDRRSGDSGRAFKVETNKVVVEFEPPVPVIMRRGYPTVIVELDDGQRLRFASLHEMRFMREAIDSGAAKSAPWREDMPAQSLDAARLSRTRSAIHQALCELEDSGELGE